MTTGEVVRTHPEPWRRRGEAEEDGGGWEDKETEKEKQSGWEVNSITLDAPFWAHHYDKENYK